jgi:hypothetical protein
MTDSELSQIFNELYFGGCRAGWSYEDLPSVQVLISDRGVWARHVDADNQAGAWVLLPPQQSRR